MKTNTQCGCTYSCAMQETYTTSSCYNKSWDHHHMQLKHIQTIVQLIPSWWNKTCSWFHHDGTNLQLIQLRWNKPCSWFHHDETMMKQWWNNDETNCAVDSIMMKQTAVLFIMMEPTAQLVECATHVCLSWLIQQAFQPFLNCAMSLDLHSTDALDTTLSFQEMVCRILWARCGSVAAKYEPAQPTGVPMLSCIKVVFQQRSDKEVPPVVKTGTVTH